MSCNTWFIGDTHFFHKNIIDYENRPFSSVEEMNEELIKTWNQRVKKEDRIIVVGDFTFNPKKYTRYLCDRLQGYKILVMGNHDTATPKFFMDNGFDQAVRFPILFEDFWLVSHEPKYINKNMPYANIFAHVHGNPEFRDYTNQSICVSIERPHMDYGPISFNKIKGLVLGDG